MDQIAHMYLDSFLIWVHEMQKIGGGFNKHDTLRVISQHLKNHNASTNYTQYIREMRAPGTEELLNKFLSVDDDMEEAKEAMKDELL